MRSTAIELTDMRSMVLGKWKVLMKNGDVKKR